MKMMHVTFGEAVSPFGVGDKRLVPADVAEQLEREGKLSACEPFPSEEDAPPRKPTIAQRLAPQRARAHGNRDHRSTR
jgi:hypothetical protein